MPEYSAIIRSLGPDRFAEILSASARKARETYFHRHRIRAPKLAGSSLKVGRRAEARIAALFAVLTGHDDEEMAEEILRTWLLARRTLLGATLDHLGIAHTDGLTESDDVKKIESLSAPELQALIAHLRDQNIAPVVDIAIYLKYMGAQGVDAALKEGSDPGQNGAR